MPGSIYNINGIPEGSPKRSNQLIWQYMMFARRFVQVIGQDLLGFTDALVGRCKNGNDLGSQFGDQFRDRKALTKSHGRAVLGGVRPGEKVHFRRMMSHYWDNFSPFMLDLFGAVIRQGTFVQKMDDIDWLHSPTVTEMTDRLTRKYKVFLDIMHQKPRNMAVPTLDVDLAWQTHQLSPGNHYKYTTTPLLRGTRRFIDHDDKVGENKLSEASNGPASYTDGSPTAASTASVPAGAARPREPQTSTTAFLTSDQPATHATMLTLSTIGQTYRPTQRRTRISQRAAPSARRPKRSRIL